MYVLQQIHRTAVATPTKLAIVFNGAPVTFGGFWRLIAATREALAPHVPSEGVALLWVDNLLETWILSLALRSLGVHTASLRGPEQIELFAASPVVGVITLASERGGPIATPAGVKGLSLSDPSKFLMSPAAQGPLPPLPDIPGRGGAHITLTSGTTGIPKKVLKDFGCDEAPVKARQQRYVDLEGYLQRGDEALTNVFDMALWSTGGLTQPILSWATGGGVLIDQRGDLARAFDWPGITHTMVTPWYLSRLMALPEGAFPYLPNMQLMIVSGAVTPVLLRQTLRRLTPHIGINLASTEAGGWARTIVKSEEDLRWYRLDPKRTVEVVDDADQPLPVGELGRVRVLLRPDNATGYMDDAETTAKFFADGWFYPGDLGVLDGKGRLALYGRTTDIVHIEGVKIPAEPWERALQDRLGCEAVCVISGSWRSEAEELHVFIESRRPIPNAELAEAVNATLSGFPQCQAHVVDALPRTGTGKVRRVALAQMLHEGAFRPEPAQLIQPNANVI